MPTIEVHHIALTTTEMDTAAQFYDAVLGEFGYRRTHGSPNLSVWVGDGPEFLVYAAEGSDRSPHTHGRPGLQHIALRVQHKDQVLRVYDVATANGGVQVHAPRLYPEYAEGYFAAFVTDPDGSRLEFAFIPNEV